MNVKNFFVLLLVVTGVTLAMTIPATAQSNETTDTSTPTNESSIMEVGEYVTLQDYSVNDDNVITIKLKSEVGSRPVKLTDMNSGKGNQGAYEFDTKSATLSKGTNTLRMKLTPDGGRVEVSIATHGGTVGIAEGTSSTLFNRSYNGEIVVALMALSGLVGVTVVGISAFKREQEVSENIEQEL